MWARALNNAASALRTPNLPKNGSKGIQTLFRRKLKWTLIVCTVVVAMSGGVDSSVTAKLLAEKVRPVKESFTRFCPRLSKRTMTSPPSLCGIGTPGTNRALM